MFARSIYGIIPHLKWNRFDFFSVKRNISAESENGTMVLGKVEFEVPGGGHSIL